MNWNEDKKILMIYDWFSVSIKVSKASWKVNVLKKSFKKS